MKIDREFAMSMNHYYNSFKKPTENRTHHGLMADYLGAMALSLYNWDKNFVPSKGELNPDYYYQLAFAGLFEDNTNKPVTEVLSLIPSTSSIQKILQIIENEQEGKAAALGKKDNCN